MTYNINAFGITLNPLSEKTLFIKNFSIYKLYKDRSSLERKLARKQDKYLEGELHKRMNIFALRNNEANQRLELLCRFQSCSIVS